MTNDLLNLVLGTTEEYSVIMHLSNVIVSNNFKVCTFQWQNLLPKYCRLIFEKKYIIFPIVQKYTINRNWNGHLFHIGFTVLVVRISLGLKSENDVASFFVFSQ